MKIRSLYPTHVAGYPLDYLPTDPDVDGFEAIVWFDHRYTDCRVLSCDNLRNFHRALNAIEESLGYRK